MSESFKEILNQLATSAKLHTANLYTLSRMSREDLEIFQNVWPAIPADRRGAIMQELVEISEINFEVDFDPIFLLGLGDEEADVRRAAINGLWEHENPSLIEPLVHLLRTDEAMMVRAAAATALGKFIKLRELEKLNPYQVLLAEEALLETVRHPKEDIEVRRRAVESIAYASDSRIPHIIENAYYDDDEKMQVSAIFAMGRSADSRWRSRVVAELNNPNTEIRFEAARACGELEASEAVEKLVDLIEEDPDLEVRQMAIWALGGIGGPVAREVLETYTESEVEALALAADEALNELNLLSGGSFELFDFGGDEFDDDDLAELFELDDTNGSNPSN